jgi:hypothetical protein
MAVSEQAPGHLYAIDTKLRIDYQKVFRYEEDLSEEEIAGIVLRGYPVIEITPDEYDAGTSDPR